jgi:hypothetical protein
VLLSLGMRTCVRVTSKGSIVGQLQRALAKRDVLAVRSLAGELPNVPLPIAAEITVVLFGEGTGVLRAGSAATVGARSLGALNAVAPAQRCCVDPCGARG